MSSVPPPGAWLPPSAEPEPPADPALRDASAASEGSAWPPWTAPLALITAFAAAIVGGLVVAIVGSAFGASLQHPPPAVNIAATVVQDVSFVGAALFYARRGGPLVPVQFGLRTTALWGALKKMVLAVVVYVVLSGIWAALIHVKERDQLPSDLGVHASTLGLIGVCVLVTVIAPIAEELFFRGYFFGALRNWRGPWPAAALTGVVFGAIHVGSAPVAFLVPLALLGFLLCLLRWRTGSLLPCLAAHAANNAIAFGANEVHWTWWQTLLLIAGATGAVLLATVPFLGSGSARGRATRDARALD